MTTYLILLHGFAGVFFLMLFLVWRSGNLLNATIKGLLFIFSLLLNIEALRHAGVL